MSKTSKEMIDAVSSAYYGKFFALEDTFSTPVPSIIYHYTNVSSLISIIENKTLWASRAEYLNDASEFQYGLNICRGELKKLANVGAEYEKFVDRINVGMSSTSNSPFVACFCQSGDLLSQWRGYSAHGQGLSIGFHSKPLSELDRVRLENVIYDRRAQVDFHWQHVKLLADAFITTDADLDDEAVLGELVGYTGALERASAIMKDSAFQEENETRIFVSDWSVKPADIRFRSRNNLIVPYIEVPLAKVWSGAIEEVIVGPGPDPDVRVSNIKHFLEIKGLGNIAVKASKCQLR
jgi:hypothetical protein